MKFTFVTIIALSLLHSPSASAAEFQHWVNEPEKTVIVANNPSLKLQLVKLEADETYYASLEIDLSYKSGRQRQLEALMAQYPGYKMQLAILEKKDAYRLQVPAMQIDREVEPNPGSEGPWVAEILWLNRKQYQAVKAELSAGREVARLSGQLSVTMPMVKLVERKELDASICESLLGKERDMHAVLGRVSSLMQQQIDTLGIQHESTRSALERDIRRNCFELNGPARVDSFAEVLQLRLRAKKLNRKLFGETFSKVFVKEDLPLAYDFEQREAK